MSVSSSEKTVWQIPTRDRLAEEVLVRELGVPTLVASVLVRRGLTDPAKAMKFISPSLDELHDPKLLPDFEPAVRAILGARERGELIYVHGDYDVDGVSSTALMTRFLERVGCKVASHVPHRMKEGYGIHLDAVEWAKDQGTSLFLTCDCGISAHEQLQAVYGAGMKAVVTDHHEPKSTMPPAEAVVNPHRPDSKYPFPDLAGAGVVFKLCMGISDQLGIPREKYLRAFLDLAVLGTVADVMPLVDENRIITKFGLEQLTQSQKKGVRALLDVCQLTRGAKLASRDIGFKLGPRINAVGRIDDADVALQMFLTEDRRLAEEHAQYLDRRNSARREQQAEMIDQAKEMVLERGLDQRMVMVLASEEWHPGIIGIVAGKLAEEYRRPTFVIAKGEDGVAKGSARSVPGFNLAEAINRHSELLVGGGGHAAAAGVTIRTDKIEEFADALHAYASEFFTEDDFRPVLSVDAEVEANEAGPMAAEAMELLQPFGEANPEPLFVSRGMRLSSLKRMRTPEHAMVTLTDGATSVSGVAWRLADPLDALPPRTLIDVAYRLEIDEWQGNRRTRWSIQDFRPSE